VRPRLPTFRTMQGTWENQPPVPEGSVWKANASIPEIRQG
jgi:hypothetical protein